MLLPPFEPSEQLIWDTLIKANIWVGNGTHDDDGEVATSPGERRLNQNYSTGPNHCQR
jgi:hypothetical protein